MSQRSDHLKVKMTVSSLNSNSLHSHWISRDMVERNIQHTYIHFSELKKEKVIHFLSKTSKPKLVR